MAGKNYEQTGSIVRSVEGDTLISAQKIDVKAAENRYTNDHIHTEQQKGLTVAVNVPVVQLAQSALAIADTAKQVGQSKNDRINAMAAANTAWQAYETGKSATEMMGQDGKPLDVSVSLTYGEQKNRHESHHTATEAESSLVQSGGTSTLIATGAGKESDINITGSDVLGGKGTYLLADDAINLTSAQQHSTENSSNKSSGWNVGGSIGSQGWGVTAGGNKGKGHGNGESLTHRHTQVGDSNSATVLQSGGTTTIKGAQVHGKGIDLNTQDLLIESVQDTEKFNSKQQNISGQVTIGGGASVSGSYNKSKVNADHASVNQQSGIYAGDDGYRAHVTKHTDLKGGLITSTAKAQADGKNQFSTNSLSHSDIENHSHYDAKGMGVSGGFGFNADFRLGDKAAPQSSMKATDEKGNVITDANGNAQLATGKESLQSKGKSIGYGSDGESERSVSQSGINTKNSQIHQDPTGELAKSVYTDITTETAVQHSGSLKNSFDKDKVRQGIDLQVKVSQDFNRNGQSALAEINTKVKSHLDEAKALEKQAQEAEARGDTAEAEKLTAKAKDERQSAGNWQHAGVGLNMLISGLSAPTESVAGIATATLALAVSYEIGQQFKNLAKENADGKLNDQQKAAHVLAHAVLGAAVAATGGNDAMAGALSAGGAEAIAPVVSQFMYGTDDPEKLTAEQKETIASISSLAGAGVGAAAGNSTINAVQSSLNVENAVENNSLKVVSSLGKLVVKSFDDLQALYKKKGRITAQDVKDSAHKNGVEELADIADDVVTIFDGNSSYFERLGALFDLVSGLDTTKGKSQTAKEIENFKKDYLEAQRQAKIVKNITAANRYKPSDVEIKRINSNAELIAHGKDIDKVNELVEKFGGDAKDWKKMKGRDSQGREYHWYTRGDGLKVGWKIKGVHPYDPF